MNSSGQNTFLRVFLFLAIACWGSSAAAQTATQSPSNALTIAQATAFELSENGEPVPVQASFILLNISAIRDELETVEFSGVLKLVWQDKRQAFDPAKEGAREKVYSGNYQFNELSPSWYPQVTLVNAAGRYESRAVILRVKPDGTSTLTQAIDAVAKMNLDMRRYPFDSHRLEAVFGVLGFDGDEVRLETTPSSAVLPEQRITVPQWTLQGIESSTRKI
jgi:hypothetical protein